MSVTACGNVRDWNFNRALGPWRPTVRRDVQIAVHRTDHLAGCRPMLPTRINFELLEMRIFETRIF